MAIKRFKRFGARSSRKRARYSRRYYRRRNRKFKRYYRRGRRFPRATEVKSVSFYSKQIWQFDQDLANQDVTFYPGFVTMFPSPQIGIDITQGTNTNQRIGAKVTPIKLRLSGSLSLDRVFAKPDIQPQSFHVRLIVYQVRGGNGSFNPNQSGYHPLAMATNTGLLDASQLQKLLSYYDGQGTTFQTSVMRSNMGTSKVPLRLGIGGQFRMLYTKTFVLSNQFSSTKPFRIVTKVPRRFVWPETPDGLQDNAPQAKCRNSVYVVWICVPQTANPIGDVHLNYNTQLFYIDK
ncbi:Cap [Circoviridae sp.]|nr:Cap [Circoviridae sp.]